MNQGNIEFEAIKTESGVLLGSVDEAETAVKRLDGLMESLCEKNDAPALKKANGVLTETVTNFIKAIRSEMEVVQQMTKSTEKLAQASGYEN